LKKKSLILLFLVTFALTCSYGRVVVEAQDLPDLTVTDLYWEPEYPTTTVKFTIVIANDGKADVTQSFVVKLFVDTLDFPEARWNFGPSDLPVKPGDAFNCFTGQISLAHRNHKIIAQVDPLQQVPDADRSNNILEKTLEYSTSTATTTMATFTSVILSTTTWSVTATELSAIIQNLDYPRQVDKGETFKILVAVDFAFPEPGRLGIEIDDLATDHILATQFSGNIRYGGMAYFTIWIIAPYQDVLWKLDVQVRVAQPGGSFYMVDHRNVSITVGSATIVTSTATTGTSTTTHVPTHSLTSKSTTNLATIPTTSQSNQLLLIDPKTIGIIVVAVVVVAVGIVLMKRKSTLKPAPTTKVCKICGKVLPFDAKYCNECGSRQ
jgi:hypothetical protein